MITSLVLAGVLMAQSAAPVVTVEARDERVDVGYAELAQGQPEAAIARIHANSAVQAGDPAALINLAAAHARLGQTTKARECIAAAIASQDRYDLQLADGSWMDSRSAARLAKARLADNTVLALR